MAKFIFALILMVPCLVFAEADFTIIRETSAASQPNFEAVALHCTSDAPKLAHCKISRTHAGVIEKSIDLKSQSAKEILDDGVKKLGKYSGTKISSDHTRLEWSVEYGGHKISGGTDSKSKKDRRALLASLLKLETRMNQEVAK